MSREATSNEQTSQEGKPDPSKIVSQSGAENFFSAVDSFLDHS